MRELEINEANDISAGTSTLLTSLYFANAAVNGILVGLGLESIVRKGPSTLSIAQVLWGSSSQIINEILVRRRWKNIPTEEIQKA